MLLAVVFTVLQQMFLEKEIVRITFTIHKIKKKKNRLFLFIKSICIFINT